MSFPMKTLALYLRCCLVVYKVSANWPLGQLIEASFNDCMRGGEQQYVLRMNLDWT